MDEERWRRHHAVIARAHELIATADELLDECAIRKATRPDRPDALQAWAASMPPKPQPDRVKPEEIRRMAARHKAERHKADTKAELHKFMRETRLYRDNLEKALGKVIADQRKETAALRDEVTKLRAQIEAMRIAAASPPVRRLVQSPRTIGHAVSA